MSFAHSPRPRRLHLQCGLEKDHPRNRPGQNSRVSARYAPPPKNIAVCRSCRQRCIRVGVFGGIVQPGVLRENPPGKPVVHNLPAKARSWGPFALTRGLDLSCPCPWPTKPARPPDSFERDSSSQAQYISQLFRQTLPRGWRLCSQTEFPVGSFCISRRHFWR